MSSVERLQDGATEVRLDYEEISTRQLVIVIQGLPAAVGDSLAPTATGGPAIAPAAGSNGNVRHRSPSSPLAEEARAINVAPAYAPVLVTSLVLAAWRGQETRVLELVAAMLEDAPAEDERRATALADYAKAVLYNGLGRYQDALSAAELACVHEDLGPYPSALLELVEAAARNNRCDIASEAVARLEERARADGTEQALGVCARSAALLSESDQAEALYREAIDLLDRRRNAIQLARTQLVYGEWLRRENRRLDARVQLRSAHNTFSRIAAQAFAERALRELHATGETARKRTDETRAYLTPQEAQIARLARDGFSNPQIGAQLFISPRTAQYHLRKVFQKLGITSRNQLARIPADRLGAGGDRRAPWPINSDSDGATLVA